MRIGGSLDLATLLTEVVEGARVHAGARCGAISAATVPQSPLDFVGSGLAPEAQAP